MTSRAHLRATWVLLALLVAVVAWGAFVRATGSGAGCGAHWPVCNGQVVPRAPAFETLVEFGHRVSSGVVFLGVLAWAIWGFRTTKGGHPVRTGAAVGLALMVAEVLVGAGLVVFGLVAKNDSVARAVVMCVHLVLTLLLLGAVGATLAWARGTPRPVLRGQGVLGTLLPLSLLALLAVGVSGAIAALGDTLFPARSLAEGLRQDLSPTAHVLLRLRVLHPVLAAATACLVVVSAGLASFLRPSEAVRRTAAFTGGIVLVQLVAGMVNLALLAPVWMQLVHLTLADTVWVATVLLATRALAPDAPRLAVPVGAPPDDVARVTAGPR